MFLLLVYLAVVLPTATAYLRAGVAIIDATMPIGTPLAGFNHGDRRVPYWPVPQPAQYTTFMMPSIGVKDPNYAKALVLDDGHIKICIVTLDGVGSDGTLNELAYDIAVDKGFAIPFDNVIFSSSHSHSGPGAVSPAFLWAMAPATDVMVPFLQRYLAERMALAMLEATADLQDAKMDMGIAQLVGVTTNRRAHISPYLKPGSIDPNLGVMRVDKADGSPLATLWNFAIHGVCYGPSNMEFSSDIMGRASAIIEQTTGAASLFVNADAGDIDPGPGMCDGAPNFKGSGLMAAAVIAKRAQLQPTNTNITFEAVSHVIDFGPTNLNFTLQRWDNCTQGGPLDLCSICLWLRCEEDLALYSNWIETTPRFSAFAIRIGKILNVITTLPGEPLLDLGWWVRNDTASLDIVHTFLAGYSNNHMGYFATPQEYVLGGYESQLTFWGIGTAERMRQGSYGAVLAAITKLKELLFND